jgi:hypothetical protein
MTGVFNGFLHEHRIIQAKWRLFEKLFGTSETVDLLNRQGAHSFGLIEDILVKDLILAITRMMNSSKASWGDPANLATILIDLVAHKQTAIAKRLTEIRDRVKPSVEELKRWRDEKIARNNYTAFVRLKAEREALPSCYRKMVDDFLASMEEILRELQVHYSGLEELQEHAYQSGDFVELLGRLRELEQLKAK